MTLIALDATAPLKFTPTAFGASFLNLAVTTPTAEGGAAVAGRGIAITFSTSCA